MASSLPSKRSRRVKASAVEPANPTTTSFPPGERRLTFRAVPLITVGPRLTCPSPAITTWLPLRTPIMVVPCHPGSFVSVMRVSSIWKLYGKCPGWRQGQEKGAHRGACYLMFYIILNCVFDPTFQRSLWRSTSLV